MKCKILITFALLILPNAYTQNLYTKDSVLNKAFTLAVNTLYKNSPDSLIKAGGEYGGEWTRDVSINAWNASTLLIPEKTKYSLWSVTENGRKTISHQYWDKIIWTIAAWDYYLKTADTAFLQQAYTTCKNTMEELELTAFDKIYNLFTGPSVFNDGIAGYEFPVFDPYIVSSFVLDHPASKYIKCLSTNCVYFQSYNSLALMAQEFNDKANAKIYTAKAKKLKQSVRNNFYDKENNKLYYLIDNTGKIHKFQEGLGISFAVLFNIVDKKEARLLLEGIYRDKYGLPSIYPCFERFSADKPGRHNQIVWPFVNAFFAQACYKTGNTDVFLKEFRNLADLAVNKSDNCFYEIYNGNTGLQDGGWQQGYAWNSVHDQTWSATGFLRMVIYGLLGMDFTEQGIIFRPEGKVINETGFTILEGLRYRNTTLTIIKKGSGEKLSHIIVNGKKQSAKQAVNTLKGNTVIELVMK
ncbi:MAG: hypothetical protein IJ250_02515 [Bacteroidales bacterium]|nr:hypothetical protein [Bacteroidales bacterium]